MPKRPHGVRQQDWQAMQNAAYDRKVNPAKSDGMVALVPVPCTCSWKPTPHYGHGWSGEWERVPREEFERRRAEGGGHVYSRGVR